MPEEVRDATQHRYELGKQFRELHRSNRKWMLAIQKQEAISRERPEMMVLNDDGSVLEAAYFEQADEQPVIVADIDLSDRSTSLVEEIKEERPLVEADEPHRPEMVKDGIAQVERADQISPEGIGEFVLVGIIAATGLALVIGIALIIIRPSS